MANVNNTVVNTVAIPTQPGRRGGTLRRGNPGNRGGKGRHSDKLREELRAVGARGIAKVVGPIIDADLVATLEEGGAIKVTPDPGLKLRAVDVALKYAIGPLQGVAEDVITDKLKATIALAHELLPDPEATVFVSRMRKIWK